MRGHSHAFLSLLGIFWMLGSQSVRAQAPFDGCVEKGGSNATLVVGELAVITRDGSPISFGSKIAAFTPDGICAGSGTWNGTTTAFTVWADDPLQPDQDGMKLGERLDLRIWDADDGVEYRTTAQLLDGISLRGSTGEFSHDAVFVLQSLSTREAVTRIGDDSNPQALQIRLSDSYPNPFSGATTIPFNVPTATPVTLEVFNTAGARVATLIDGAVLEGQQEVRWAPSGLPAGLYIVRLRVGDTVRTGSLIHVD